SFLVNFPSFLVNFPSLPFSSGWRIRYFLTAFGIYLLQSFGTFNALSLLDGRIYLLPAETCPAYQFIILFSRSSPVHIFCKKKSFPAEEFVLYSVFYEIPRKIAGCKGIIKDGFVIGKINVVHYYYSSKHFLKGFNRF